MKKIECNIEGSKPFPSLYGHSQALVDTKLFIFGGFKEDNQFHNSEIYILELDSERTKKMTRESKENPRFQDSTV